MATPVTVINQPDQNVNNLCVIRPAFSPFYVQFSSEVIGVAAQAFFAVLPGSAGGALLNGETLTINNLNITASDTPVLGQLPTSAIASQNEIASALSAILNGNAGFATIYNITTDVLIGGAIILYIKAKKPGTAYSITYSTTSAYLPALSNQPGADAYRANQFANYAVWVEVYRNQTQQLGLQIPDNGDLVASLEKPFTKNNIFYFDLSAAIQYFTKGTPGHTDQPTQITLCQQVITQFYIKYGEQYKTAWGGQVRTPLGELGRVPTGSSELSKIWWVLHAALQKDLTQPAIDAAMSLYHIPVKDPPVVSSQLVSFLTRQPLIKTTSANELANVEFLYFIFIPPYESKTWQLRLVVNICYVDGTTEQFYAWTEYLATPQWGGVYFINTGFSKLQLNSYEQVAGKPVKYYTCQLQYVDNANIFAFTNIQTYQVDNENRCAWSTNGGQNLFIVEWLNSLGGYDTFQFTGSWQVELDRLETQTYFTIPQLQYQSQSEAAFRADQYTSNQLPEYKAIISTNYVDGAHYTWLQELLKSPELYLYCPSNPIPGQTDANDYRRANILTAKWARDSIALNYMLTIECSLGYTQNTINQ